MLQRKLADQCGLTAALEGALARAGTFPQFSRDVVVVSMAVANTLGATSMSDILVLAQLVPVLGAAPSGSTVRRVPGRADARTLARIAQARARIHAHVWKQVEEAPAGFPWLRIAGKTLTGWLMIDISSPLPRPHPWPPPRQPDAANGGVQILGGIVVVAAPPLLGALADHLGLMLAFGIEPLLVAAFGLLLLAGTLMNQLYPDRSPRPTSMPFAAPAAVTARKSHGQPR